jgi:hypothetical protein
MRIPSCLIALSNNNIVLYEEMIPTQNQKSFTYYSRNVVKEMVLCENIVLANTQQDTQGPNSWNGLLDPINLVLKVQILKLWM